MLHCFLSVLRSIALLHLFCVLVLLYCIYLCTRTALLHYYCTSNALLHLYCEVEMIALYLLYLETCIYKLYC